MILKIVLNKFMDETEIIKFDTTESQLRAIVAETIGIVNVDIENKEEIEKVKKSRIALGKVRVDIQKFGKGKRDWFNEMSKKIITREKELIAIIEPEEDRLYAFEEEVKKQKELADRLAVLPLRKEQLGKIGIIILPNDDVICSMDSTEFMAFCNKLVAEKNEADAKALEERESKLHEAENEVKRKEDIRIAEDKAREEERARADQREKDRIESERITAEKETQRINQEKLDKEEKEKADKESQAKDQKYQAWLKDNGWTEETKTDFVIEKVNNKVRLSKIIAIYSFENNA